MEQLINATGKIEEVSQKKTQKGVVYTALKIGGKTYRLNHFKQDGAETKAFTELKSLDNGGMDIIVTVGYEESHYNNAAGQPVVSKYIRTLALADGDIKQYQKPAETNGKPETTYEKVETEDEKWKRINGEKTDSINWFNAKNNAVQITCDLIKPKGDGVTKECITDWANWLFNLKPVEKVEQVKKEIENIIDLKPSEKDSENLPF